MLRYQGMAKQIRQQRRQHQVRTLKEKDNILAPLSDSNEASKSLSSYRNAELPMLPKGGFRAASCNHHHTTIVRTLHRLAKPSILPLARQQLARRIDRAVKRLSR